MSQDSVLLDWLLSEQQAADDLRKAFLGAEVRNSELAAKLENVTRKVDQLQELVQRLEERLSNSESEIQLLCQQALNENLLKGETTPDMTLAVREPEPEEKPQKSPFKKEEEGQDLLVKCISQNLGFAAGKPVAACVIYKCLFHWRSFEVEETNIFDRIIQTILSATEAPDNNEVLAYWLSNSATLFSFLKRTFITTGVARPRTRRRTTPASLIARLSWQQAPRKQGNDVPQQALIAPWQSIKNKLDTYLNLMKENNVPPFLVQKVFTQIFIFINIQLFNSLLLRKECCSLSNGEYVEAGLAEFEKWCVEATDEYTGSAWDELRHTREAVGFLVIKRKPKLTLDEIAREHCPMLSIQHIYRISTMYSDKKYGTHTVSSEVLAKIRVMMMTEEKSDDCVSRSFLLEDDSSIPFAVEEILQQVEIYNTELPQLLLEHPDAFGFLRQPDWEFLIKNSHI